ncbi:hypothetical protein [Sphingomonas hankookensis]|uniref:Uncharacterized protein n=1 Tax=Sphingomonas hengshuiensis TaxID=1609977 RepID=A0A2W5B1G6_9SPHN|nr:MAG: hypothetical protein DI632_10105 [Sphingomonas hengshuiensis]
MEPEPPVRPPASQHAALMLRAGRRLRLKARVDVTPVGLLSIGALVSAILLSSAAIVVAARMPRQDGSHGGS